MKLTSILALFTVSSAAAFGQSGASDTLPVISCRQINQAVMTLLASGRLAEAEAALPVVPVSGDELGQGACAGHILSNMAVVFSLSGRIAESERLAEKSVRILEKLYPANDWVLLRPLQVLAAVQLESGKTARAREAVKRMQSIELRRPEDSAIVHATTGTLLHIEGRRSEAEAEYLVALRSWDQAGRADSADAAAILHCLASLYLKEQRLEDARQILDRAQALYNRAKDTLPMDCIKLLELRGVLHAWSGDWQRAEQDLADALSMIDRLPAVDPAFLRPLLVNYSYVLRKNHRRQESRSIDLRMAALPAGGTSAAAVVDYESLLAEKRAARK